MTDKEIATNHKLPEVPMNPHDELLLWHALHRLEVAYWYDVDFNEGRTAHEFFTPDGVKMVGHNRFDGREKIRAFYEWRARQNGAIAVRQRRTANAAQQCWAWSFSMVVQPIHRSVAQIPQ